MKQVLVLNTDSRREEGGHKINQTPQRQKKQSSFHIKSKFGSLINYNQWEKENYHYSQLTRFDISRKTGQKKERKKEKAKRKEEAKEKGTSKRTIGRIWQPRAFSCIATASLHSPFFSEEIGKWLIDSNEKFSDPVQYYRCTSPYVCTRQRVLYLQNFRDK